MNPVKNPYTPGAGNPPRELSGRHSVLETVMISLARQAAGGSSKNTILIGLRGVGKTVLLNRIQSEAKANGIVTIHVEADQLESLPSALVPEIHSALFQLSRREAAKDLVMRATRAVLGFAAAWRISYQGLEAQLDLEPEPGLANNGHLETDLRDLFESVGRAAQAAGTAFAVFIDELQYLPNDELASLIRALHRIAQWQLPVGMVGAGLPQLRGRLGDAKSYAERMFEFPVIGPLPPEHAAEAVEMPARSRGAEIERAAVEAILDRSKGYPYFLQAWGKHAWDISEGPQITGDDVDRASDFVLRELDRDFFGVRLDRLTPKERRYLRAMAELGPGPHASGAVANVLHRKVTSFGTVRKQLIDKGMIFSPDYGQTAFTVPLFDEFMRRIVPELE